jgi:hypothetical protein
LENLLDSFLEKLTEEGKEMRVGLLLLKEAEEVLRGGKEFMTATEWAIKMAEPLEEVKSQGKKRRRTK